jgi:HAD superfamily phosphoserine phosphatase-like hydrolase
MIKAILFDIDNTLTYEVSWYLLTKKLGGDTETHRKIFNNMLEGKINYQDAKSQLIELWKKTGKCNKKHFIKIFSEVKLKEDVQEVVDFIKSMGLNICLITGSVDLYAETISKRLNVNDYYANTKLIWDKKDELIDFDYEKNQGEKKLKQLKEFCLKNNISISEIIVVGDDENDIELFKFTKQGVAVKSSNSHKIETHAWKIINKLSELKQII